MLWSAAAQALSIWPNLVEIETQPGQEATVVFEAYNNDLTQEIGLTYVEDLVQSRDDDRVLDLFMLGREDRRKLPLTFVIEKTKEFYICFTQESRSLYARSCSRVRATVS
jgi:hypothetical protein